LLHLTIKTNKNNFKVKFCGHRIDGQMSPVASVKPMNHYYRNFLNSVPKLKEIELRVLKMVQDNNLSCSKKSQRSVVNLIGSLENPKYLDLYCENENSFYSYLYEENRIRHIKSIKPYFWNKYEDIRWLYYYPLTLPLLIAYDGIALLAFWDEHEKNRVPKYSPSFFTSEVTVIWNDFIVSEVISYNSSKN